MGIIENNRNRLDRALEIANQIIDQTEKETQTVIYGFDVDTMRYTNLSIDTTTLGTNIDKSLRSIISSEKTATNLILISDGNFSIGDNPLYSDYLNQINLYAVGVGDTNELPDVMIAEVKSNKIVYQDKATQVQVYIMSRGIDSQRLNLSMKQDDRILQIKDSQVNADGKTSIVEFELIPEKVGLNQFDFSLQTIPGETIVNNNQYTISMEVLKGKIEVGLLASKAGYETKFLQYILSNQDDINFNMFVKLKSGKYYKSNPEKYVDSLDVVILYNFPSVAQAEPRESQLINRLKSHRIPALIILNQSISDKQLEILKNFFPIETIRISSNILETQVEPTASINQFPALSIFENDDESEKFWSICPPIQYPYSDILFSSTVKELLRTRKPLNDDVEHPVLLAHESRGKKGILLLGLGFWRWTFLLSEDKVYQNSWQQMLKNIIRWLDTAALDKNVILSTRKKNYQVGDNILLSTQVYDGSFKFVNDGLIRTSVSGPSVSFELESSFIENGRYEGTFVPLVPGRYRIRTEAWRNNIKLGIDEIELIVTTVNREFLSTRQNYHFLKRLSEKSGGRYFNESEVGGLVSSLNLKPMLKREQETFELWNRWPFLLAIIFLLSLEWFVRKKKDLA
jgi:hypothetical protein